MSNRKLQQEFDKTNKKIAEGLTLFDDVYEKALTTELSSQRDKFETDLKKEIKKLQRLRDQLKQWLGDSTIKLDKSLLVDNRGKIENAMDRFKDLEKLSKIKQFSNEGLELSSKKKLPRFGDANEEKKQEAVDYITDIRDEISSQNELLESDVHHYTSQLKKAKSNAYSLNATIKLLKAKIERNDYHLTQLETVLRNLENEELKPEKVDLIKEYLEYYVENNQDPEFVEYNEFYDQLEMTDVHDVQGTLSKEKEEQELKDEAGKKGKQEEEETKKEEEKKFREDKPKREKEEAEKKREPVSNAPHNITPPPPPTLPRGASYSSVIKSALENSTSTPGHTNGTIIADTSIAANYNLTSSIPTPLSNHEPINNGIGTVKTTPAKVNNPPPGLTSTKSVTASPISMKLVSHNISINNNGTFIDTIPKLSRIGQSRLTHHLPYKSIGHLLENSLYNCPDSFDADKPREYNPINVHPSSIDYPQEPMYELNLYNVMSKFEEATLFYCFYYGGDTIVKYNSSKELGKRGWFYETDVKLWLSKDSQASDYKYFDYQNTWSIRILVDYQVKQESIQKFI